jgi:hypothetical protein
MMAKHIMRAGQLSIAGAICLAWASLAAGQEQTGAAQAQPNQPDPTQASAPQPAGAGQRPVNPGQETAGQQPEGKALSVGPAQLRIGGYIGLTAIHRSTNSGGGAGTRFATIPYEEDREAHVSQTRLTAESSRLSIRIDAEFPEARPRFESLAGYFEMDFSGTTPGNVAVTSTSAGFRLRNAFAEARYGDSIFLSAGQAFSLMTPAKNELSMWPSDMDLSQAVDTNYVAGLVWGRYPQFRMTWRPSKTFGWAASVENPEQQIGNGIVTLPACCAEDIESQYNTGSDGLDVPNLMPDLVTRIAFNRGVFHVDAGGVLRVFRHTVSPYTDSFKQAGGGVSVNVGVKPTPTTRLLLQSAFGSGMGRYIGGMVPDVAFHRDGTISPIDTASWVAGVEQQISRLSIAGYYSGVVADANFEQDTDGRYVGFGFPGASTTNNGKIHELRGTVSSRMMASPDRGSAQLALQVSWLEREPAFSSPASARSFLFFAQLRYNLP